MPVRIYSNNKLCIYMYNQYAYHYVNTYCHDHVCLICIMQKVRKNKEAFFTLDLFICKLIKLNKYSFINFNMYFLADIRKAEHVKGRSINLALSTRGRTALRMVGLEDTVLENGIPMHARMIHDPDGSRRPILYGKEDQVRINKILLYHCKVQTKFGKYM